MTPPLAHHLGAAVSVPVRSLAHALDLYRRRTMPDPLHPAGYRAAMNRPQQEHVPAEQPPPESVIPTTLADSQLENLQAANRQLRDDLAAAEAEVARLREALMSVGAALVEVADRP